MQLVPVLLILWGVVITIMVGLLVYNATCCSCGDNGLQTGCSEAEKCRRARIFARAQRLHPYIRASGSLSALMTLGIAGLVGWSALERLIR